MKNIKSILLVEDNLDEQELTKLAFSKCAIANELVIVNGGVEALDYLFGTGRYAGRDTSVMPAVVLLDLNLPRLDGISVLQHLRADPRTAMLPIVMLTSSLEETDIVRSYQLGANSYIRKPIDLKQFIDAIAQLQLYWLRLNVLPN